MIFMSKMKRLLDSLASDATLYNGLGSNRYHYKPGLQQYIHSVLAKHIAIPLT